MGVSMWWLAVCVSLAVVLECASAQVYDSGCPPDAECVPRHVCHEDVVRPIGHHACGEDGPRDNRVCCRRYNLASDRRPYKDYYDDRYDELHGHPLSSFARETLDNYRYKEECGVRFNSPKELARVSTGFIGEKGFTSFGEFVWHVALLVLERHNRHFNRGKLETYRYHCGATLIHPALLLTAAHCVKGVKKYRLKAHLGEWNLFGTTGELFPALERHIARVYIHSGFNPASLHNDIALLEMDRSVDLRKTPHIAPACLPRDSHKFDDDQKCFIVGWGDDIYKPILGSNVLKATSVTYTTGEDCKDKLYASMPHISDTYVLDEDTQKCIVGSYGRDACTGDGGGAVVCPLSNKDGPDACSGRDCKDEHYYVAGVVSFGSPVCGEGSVTIVTDIVENINWIETIINPGGGIRDFKKGYGGRSSQTEGSDAQESTQTPSNSTSNTSR